MRLGARTKFRGSRAPPAPLVYRHIGEEARAEPVVNRDLNNLSRAGSGWRSASATPDTSGVPDSGYAPTWTMPQIGIRRLRGNLGVAGTVKVAPPPTPGCLGQSRQRPAWSTIPHAAPGTKSARLPVPCQAIAGDPSRTADRVDDVQRTCRSTGQSRSCQLRMTGYNRSNPLLLMGIPVNITDI
jgi:hypothetical protein